MTGSQIGQWPSKAGRPALPAARLERCCGVELLSATMFQGAEAEAAKPSSRWGGGRRLAGRGEESCGGAESLAGLWAREVRAPAEGREGKRGVGRDVGSGGGDWAPRGASSLRRAETEPHTSRTAGQKPARGWYLRCPSVDLSRAPGAGRGVAALRCRRCCLGLRPCLRRTRRAPGLGGTPTIAVPSLTPELLQGL